MPQTVIPLSSGAPFGEIEVNLDTCTMCMACVGACPEAALADGRDRPQLRFSEANCVQCGLCEQACPEDAIMPVPRLLVGREAKGGNLTLSMTATFTDGPPPSRQVRKVTLVVAPFALVQLKSLEQRTWTV